MELSDIQTYFVCKLCKSSFEQVKQFMKHKKEKHFQQFKNIKCIVFEETRNDAVSFEVIDEISPKATNDTSETNFQTLDINDDIYIEPNHGINILPLKNHKNLSIDLSIILNDHCYFQSMPAVTIKTEPLEAASNNTEHHDDVEIAVLETTELNSETEDITETKRSDIFSETQCLFVQEWQEFPEVKHQTNKLYRSHSNNGRRKIKVLNRKTYNKPSSKLNPFVRLQRLSSSKIVSASNFHEIEPQLITFEDEDSSTSFDSNFTEETPIFYKCSLCNKSFNSESPFKIHVGICSLYRKRRTKKDVSARHACHLCSKDFLWRSSLCRHLRAHRETQRFACTEPGCSLKFKSEQYLRDHWVRKHGPELPYACMEDSCGKRFHKPCLLRQHMVEKHCK